MGDAEIHEHPTLADAKFRQKTRRLQENIDEEYAKEETVIGKIKAIFGFKNAFGVRGFLPRGDRPR